MRIERIAVLLTATNLVLLALILVWSVNQGIAPGVAPRLRARELEIVDSQGKGRAQIIVAPATTLQDGTVYPETVLLRLSDQNGAPEVKLSAAADGAILVLGGGSERPEWNGVQILGNGSTVRLTNKDGREQIIRP